MKETEIRLAVCPGCGKPCRGHPALSRVDDETLICPDCGTREALESVGMDATRQDKIIDTIVGMDIEAMLAEVEKCRAAAHRVVDAHFDLIARSIQAGEPLPKRDTVLPLSTAPYHFKGTKPAAVIFPDGRRVEVTKWKAVVTVILRECVDTPPCGERLMSLRGKIMGRQRMILSASPKGMDVPLEIGPELFMEGKFDTESLIYVLTKRVLDPAGYSYGGISIQLRQSERR